MKNKIDTTIKKPRNLKRDVIYTGSFILLVMVMTLAVALVYTWEAHLQKVGALVTLPAPTPFNTALIGFISEQWLLIANSLLGVIVVFALLVIMYKNANQVSLALNASTHDTLTGLYNRRYLDDQFQRLWLESQRDGMPISVLFIDIDHFKRFNDQFGHEKGDTVLINVAKTIRQSLRRPLDFCCRWGGEEFVVVMPKTPASGALDVADHILGAVAEICTDFCGTGHTPITVSIGIATTKVTADNIHDDLIDQSDKAMLLAKANGRNRVEVYGK